jgi:hypothetical protein
MPPPIVTAASRYKKIDTTTNLRRRLISSAACPFFANDGVLSFTQCRPLQHTVAMTMSGVAMIRNAIERPEPALLPSSLPVPALIICSRREEQDHWPE